MYGRPHSILLEEMLQCVTLSTKDGEDMVDAARPFRQSHQGVADMVNIIIGYSLPAGVVRPQTNAFNESGITEGKCTALPAEEEE